MMLNYQEDAEVAPEPVQYCCEEYRRAAFIPGDIRQDLKKVTLIACILLVAVLISK